MKEMANSNGKIVTTVVENCYNCSGKICYKFKILLLQIGFRKGFTNHQETINTGGDH